MADFSVTMNAGVCHIGITRPEKRNTLNAQACATLVELLAQAQRDPEVRVVVLSVTTRFSAPASTLPKTFNAQKPTKQPLMHSSKQ